MVEGGNMAGVGRIYVDGKGAGRLYIPKELMSSLTFENRGKVLIRVVNRSKLVIERFENAVLEEV